MSLKVCIVYCKYVQMEAAEGDLLGASVIKVWDNYNCNDMTLEYKGTAVGDISFICLK